MNAKVKLGVYAVLLLLAAWCAWGFYSNYNAATKAPDEVSAPATAPTNVDTNSVSTTNVAAATNSAPATPAPSHGAHSRMIVYLAAFVGVIVLLGLLIAYDVSQVVGGAAVDFIFDDRGQGARSPEYEKAEQVWANGEFLEAVRLMRDFLKDNPREQYAALRIAEIYEKDLNNPLAAALEYEEILKKKLPAEKWGWSAIHLCNLYSKIGQQEKTRELLQRIADEYPKTKAAVKARSRLGLPEPEPEAAPAPAAADETEPDFVNPPKVSIDHMPTVTASELGEEEPAPTPQPSAPAAPDLSKPSLPPGFRPKK